MDIPSIENDNKKYHGLRRFNLIMAVLHATQGILMLILSSSFALPITTSFLGLNRATEKLEPVLKTLTTIHLGPLVAGFLFISATAHLMISLPGIYEWYKRNLGKGMNLARWIEYSLSSSLMIVIIAMLVGIYDIATLICLFGVNAAMILFGWMMELHNQSTPKTSWVSFIFGCLVGAIPWIAVGIYLFGPTDKAPTFVYWIYLSIFLFFNCFELNMILQYKKVGKWRDYLYGERAYIVLSLVAKSLLAWQVWAGTLRPV